MSGIGISADDIDWARSINPDGVLRLAKFVGAENSSSIAIEEACEKHRLTQLLAPPVRIRIRDSRAK